MRHILLALSATATEGASMMAKASKRVRSAKWGDSETTLLAKLKREAFLRGEEGRHVWQDISQTISGRSAKQCRRRWETLVKVHNHVQEYCTQTGQDHEELDDAELASMKLETAYRRDWYMIVQEVCSERKRRRIFDRRSAVMVSKGSSTPVMETLPATRPATTDGPVITAPDQGLLSAGNFTLNCFSPPISFPLCVSAEDQIQEPQDKIPVHVPKFGEWVNHSADSGPCYTIVLDSYGSHRSGSVRQPRKRQFFGLLFCFTCTKSS